MRKNDKVMRLVSIDAAVLESVTGGRGLDLLGSWAYNHLASTSCQDAVLDAAVEAGNAKSDRPVPQWDDDAWAEANIAAYAAWNGPACRYYGW